MLKNKTITAIYNGLYFSIGVFSIVAVGIGIIYAIVATVMTICNFIMGW